MVLHFLILFQYFFCLQKNVVASPATQKRNPAANTTGPGNKTKYTIKY